MKELCTEIEVMGSPDEVWEVLTDLSAYPDWNPFIHQVIGTAKVGEKVDIDISTGTKKMTLHCTIIKVELNKELSWRYHVALPFLFSGKHSFTIEPLEGNKVRFIDREIFNGLLVPTLAKDIDTNSRHGFEAMDLALKARVERN